jgi:hypothetical protein
MISLSVVKIKVSDEKCLLTRYELDQVRTLLCAIKSDDPKATRVRMEEVMASKHTFENKKEYTLSLDTVKLGDVFYVWSTRHALTEKTTAQISKLITCAISAPNTLLVFPDYIVISDVPPTPTSKPKPKAKRKKKDGTK